MKTILRTLKLGVLLAALTVIGGTTVLAQDPCADVDAQNAVYGKFTENFQKKTAAELRIARDAGKELLEKYGNCASLKEQVDYVRPWVAKLDVLIPQIELSEKLSPLFTRFDAGIKSDNFDEIFAAGREILTLQPDNLNIIVPIAVAGLFQSYKEVYKNSDEAMRYAQRALADLKSGKALTKKNAKGEDTVGALKYEYTRPEAISVLTYTTAHLTNFAKKDKKGALPYYYEVTKLPGSFQKNPRVYGVIGDYYYDEVKKLADDVKAKIAAQSDTDTEEVRTKKEADIKAAIAMLNGYSERAMDAYSRAYSIAKADQANKTYTDALYKTLQTLYNVRFQKQDGIDAWISGTVTKPFPDPTSPVAPVSDPETTTTAPATTGPSPAVAKPTASPVPTKPAANGAKSVPTVKVSSTSTTAATVSTSPVKAKAVKPAAKRKGTR